jgi:hypothetical protein
VPDVFVRVFYVLPEALPAPIMQAIQAVGGHLDIIEADLHVGCPECGRVLSVCKKLTLESRSRKAAAG